MNIIITGSLGHISKPLSEELIQKGHSVTIISRNTNRKDDIEKMGAKAAIGSVDDVSFLTRTFQGADAVYCMVPPDFRQPNQIDYYSHIGNNYATAIKNSGVKRVVELSSYGAHLASGTGFIVGSHRNEKLFDSLPGIAVTHMRPGYFYYNLRSQIPVIKMAGMMAANFGGNDKLAMVSPRDIAAAIADEIVKLSGEPVRYVMSDDRTCNEVAEIVGNAIGKPGLQWITLSDADMQANLERSGMPVTTAAMLVELGAAIHSGALREDYDKQNIPLGNIKLEDYMPQFVQSYNEGGSGH